MPSNRFLPPLIIFLAISLLGCANHEWKPQLTFQWSAKVDSLMRDTSADNLEEKRLKLKVIEADNDTVAINAMNEFSEKFWDMDSKDHILLTEEILKKSRALNYRYGEVEALQNLGKASEATNELNKDSLYKLSLQKARQYDFKPLQVRALFELGLASFNNDPKKSLQYYRVALQTSSETNDQGLIASSLFNLGFCYAVMQDDSNALDYYIQSLTIAKEINDKSLEQTNYKMLYGLYKGENDETRAIGYLEKCLQFKTEQTRKDLQASEKLHQQKLISTVSTGSIIALLILATVIYLAYRQKQMANRIITGEKEK